MRSRGLVELLLITEDLRTVESLTVQLQRALYCHIEQIQRELVEVHPPCPNESSGIEISLSDPALDHQNRPNILEHSATAYTILPQDQPESDALPSFSAASFRMLSECSCRRPLSCRSGSSHSGSGATRAFAHNSRIRSCKNDGEDIRGVCWGTTIKVYTVCGVSHKTDNTLQSLGTNWSGYGKTNCVSAYHHYLCLEML